MTHYILSYGTDLLATFDKWREYEKVLTNYRLLVIARDTNQFEIEVKNYLKYKDHIELATIKPRVISSTEVRNEILKHGFTEKLKKYLYVNTIEYLKEIDIKSHWN